MKFINFIIEKFNFDFGNNKEAELESMKLFKKTFGGDSFTVKGFKYKFSNHAAHRYFERVKNESKLFLLDQLKKVSDKMKSEDDETYHVKIKSIDKGFIISKVGKILNVITVYGSEMNNLRKSTEDLIVESYIESLPVIEIE